MYKKKRRMIPTTTRTHSIRGLPVQCVEAEETYRGRALSRAPTMPWPATQDLRKMVVFLEVDHMRC